MIRGFFYRGRHRKPTHTARNAAALAATGALAVVPVGLNSGTAQAAETVAQAPAAPADLDVIAQCESGNRNVENTSGSSASGYFQIVDSTWRANGGTQFAPRAIQATRTEQRIVAERIAARRGSYADWNPSKGCWGGKVGQTSASVRAGARAEAPAPRTPSYDRATRRVTPAPGTTGGRHHLVAPGDTLSEIAVEHGTTWQVLAKKNQATIPNPDLIFPGQSIRL